MGVLDTGNRQGGCAHDRIAARQAYALIAIAAYGPRPARAKREILRQAVGIRPDFSDLCTYSQHVATPYRLPLLGAQSAAVKRFALVQRRAHAQPEIDQVAFTWIISGIHIPDRKSTRLTSSH